MTSERSEKKRRVLDAEDITIDAAKRLAKVIGPSLKLDNRDLPTDIVRLGIMKFLVLEENVQVLQKGYLSLPASVDAKKHAMPAPDEFHVSPRFMYEFTEKRAPEIIAFWERSGVGKTAKVVQLGSRKMYVGIDHMHQLLGCFPNMTDLTMDTHLEPHVFLDLLAERKVPLRCLRLQASAFVDGGNTLDWESTPSLLRLAPHLKVLQLRGPTWRGDIPTLLRGLSSELEALAITPEVAPTKQHMADLFAQCPALVDLDITLYRMWNTTTDMRGFLAEPLAKDKRLWRRFAIDGNPRMTTADLQAIAGEKLVELRISGWLHGQKVFEPIDFSKVLARCSSLERLLVRFDGIEKEELLTGWAALYNSPAATTVRELSHVSRVAVDRKMQLEHHRRLPRLEKVSISGVEAHLELLELLTDASHRDALRSLDFFVKHDVDEKTAKLLTRVIRNSTRWTDVNIQFSGASGLQSEMLVHLGQKCHDVSRVDVGAWFPDLTGDILATFLAGTRNADAVKLLPPEDQYYKVPSNGMILRKHLLKASERCRQVEVICCYMTAITEEDAADLSRIQLLIQTNGKRGVVAFGL